MGAIKDIVDICIALKKAAGNREAADAMDRIQSLAFDLQAELAGILEKNAQLMTENLDLKRKLFELEGARTQSAAQLQQAQQAAVNEHSVLQAQTSELLGENTDLRRKIYELEAKHADEVAELQQTHRTELAKAASTFAEPKDLLERQTSDILKLFFNSTNELTCLQIALTFKLSPSVAEYHIDELLKRQFIEQSSIGMNPNDRTRHGLFRIKAEGRAYMVTNKLAR